MTARAIWQVVVDGRTRAAVGSVDGPEQLLDPRVSIDALVVGGSLESDGAVTPVPPDAQIVAPVGGQQLWASGVTFVESRYAREAESGNADFYHSVYDAERPEIFLKAAPGEAVGPGADVGIRVDSRWNVPEPELALVFDPTGRMIGYTLGNDMSSRSIEGANPLYLPQAKVYQRSAAVGPCLVPVADAPPLGDIVVEMAISRDEAEVFRGSAPMANLKRTPEELGHWLFRAHEFPQGVVLMTGTSIVPPSEFTLAPGDLVEITATGLGRLVNTVCMVGRSDRLAVGEVTTP